jgi:predicted nucleic acid-binding protein
LRRNLPIRVSEATPGSSEVRPARGLLDTSVVIDLEAIPAGQLPEQVAISALTLAELAAGPHAAGNSDERARRQDRLQRTEAAFDPPPFTTAAARAYGLIYAAVVTSGRKARGPRAVDLLIAATALAEGLSLYTRNAVDLAGLTELVDVIAV